MPGPGDILVVDDTPANLLAIEAALGELSGKVVRANSGEEALRCLLERDFALVLLDVQMPSLDGLETARLIRQRRRTRHTPIIFLTAHDQSHSQVLEAYQLGAVDFLFKPLVPDILRAKAAVFVELQARTAEVARQAAQLREHERREHERMLAQARHRWEEELLRKQMDEEHQLAQAMTRKAEELACTVAELERTERELKAANQRLEETDRRKDEFLAVLAHELRNPLAPLVNGLELIKAGSQQGDATFMAARAAMERQLQHLTRLVDDLLDVSRITSGKVTLKKRTCLMFEVLQSAVATSRPLIDERRHTLAVELHPEPLHVMGDPVRLTQVVANLLNNAARYTPPGGRISLSITRDGDEVVVRITDNGTGIEAEALERIFDFFVQAQVGSGGLGIGLSLVKRLLDLHGGRVTAASDGHGRGACFEVRLPLHLADSTDEPSGPVDVHAGATHQRRLKVVVVDDNEDIRETLSALLQLWQHDVEVAGDGTRGASLILESAPDIAFVDIGLPGMDGYALARRVTAASHVPLIAMTGFGEAKDRERALAAGFVCHVVKPCPPDAIKNILFRYAKAPVPETT